MLACWVEDPNGDAFKKHLARIPDCLWISEDGMAMQVNIRLPNFVSKAIGTFEYKLLYTLLLWLLIMVGNGKKW